PGTRAGTSDNGAAMSSGPHRGTTHAMSRRRGAAARSRAQCGWPSSAIRKRLIDDVPELLHWKITDHALAVHDEARRRTDLERGRRGLVGLERGRVGVVIERAGERGDIEPGALCQCDDAIAGEVVLVGDHVVVH